MQDTTYRIRPASGLEYGGPQALRRKRVDIGSDLEAVAGKGPGLAGAAMCQYVLQSAFVAVCTRCGSSGPRANRVANQARVAKLREG
jgi:hypothetical protein